MKLKVFLTVLLFSLSSISLSATTVLCQGSTNFGDEISLELKLSGECEGNSSGQTAFCGINTEIHQPISDLPTGHKSSLFISLLDYQLVFKDRMVLSFQWKGKVIDILDWSTPLHAYNDFKGYFNYAGGRTVGSMNCNRTNLKN